MSDLLIRDVRPLGGPACDVLIGGGRIVALGPALTAAPGVAVEEGGGELLLPGLVEAHTHLDKTTWGMPWYCNAVGPGLLDRIRNERAAKRDLDIEPARQSARQVVQSSRLGTTHIRSHVDIDTEHGLAGLEGVMATREAYRDSSTSTSWPSRNRAFCGAPARWS